MTNADVVRAMYDALFAGDFVAIYEALDPEIEWAEPDLEFLPYPGLTRGRDQVAEQVFAKIGQTYEKLEFRPDEVYECGEVVTVLGRALAKGADNPEETFPFAHIMKLRDGRVYRFDHFVDTHKIARTIAGPSVRS